MSSTQRDAVEDPSLAPEWADSFGEDRYGRFAGVEVRGVEYRFRLIPTGPAQLGTSERTDEFDSEFHVVELERELWLGEVPCTQAFWKAVAGDEPSDFRDSPDRPVESISWDDCQRFLETLEAERPGLGARLPLEDEWEYACRAGTTTETYAGDLDERGASDAPVLDAIAWYRGNSGVDFDHPNGNDSSAWREKQYEHARAGTRRVGCKRPNPWGLYDMLGNVWEWCEDECSGGPERVVRGGSWDGDARNVRAAQRDWSEPAYRSRYLGVRLARGQGLVRE